MTDTDGDGVAIIGAAEPFGGGQDVSVVDIVGCTFLNCRRSGVSNQRSAELVSIHRLPLRGHRGPGHRLRALRRGARYRAAPLLDHREHLRPPLVGGLGDAERGRRRRPGRAKTSSPTTMSRRPCRHGDTRNCYFFGNHIESGLDHAGPCLVARHDRRGPHQPQPHRQGPGRRPGPVINISSRATSSPSTGSTTTPTPSRCARIGVPRATGRSALDDRIASDRAVRGHRLLAHPGRRRHPEAGDQRGRGSRRHGGGVRDNGSGRATCAVPVVERPAGRLRPPVRHG